jgi:hypothetical protein
MQEVSEEQKTLIKNAQEAIRVHRFNQLPKKVNHLATSVKKTPMRIDIMIDKLFTILEDFPLNKNNSQESQYQAILPIIKGDLPDIIISESFVK